MSILALIEGKNLEESGTFVKNSLDDLLTICFI